MLVRSLHGAATAAVALALLAAGAPAQGENKTGRNAPGHHEKTVNPPLLRPTGGATASQPVASASTIQRGPFLSVQVNIDARGNNIRRDAANEPSISVDPANPARIVIGWRQFDSISSSFRKNGWAYTPDGGATWASPGSIASSFYSDPVVDVDSQGDFYYLSYPGGTTLRVYRSSDGGASWSNGRNAPGGDKAWMTIDRSGGIGDGNIYLIWQVLHGPNTFTRSTNGGQSFRSPVRVPRTPTFGTLSVDPNGVVWAAGRDGSSSSRFVLSRSTNAQDPTRTPTFQTFTVNMGGSMALGSTPNPGGLLGQVNVAADPSRPGYVYMLGSVNPPGSDPMDVHFVRTTDGGQQFSAPVRINDDSRASNNWQWFGTMSVSPGGRIDVVWNDTRARRRGDRSETAYCYSLDAGVTWSKNVPVTPVWNSLLGHPQQNKIGDYYDMASTDDAAHLAYSATFNGEQDVYYLKLGDCNGNRTHDGVDIANGTSADSNQNGVPDKCELCQTNLGSAAGLALGVCGDALTLAEGKATLEVSGGPANSPVALVLSPARSVPPFALPGTTAGLVPDLGNPGAVVLGLLTDAQGRLRLPLLGGSRTPITLYMQAAMIATGSGLLASNAVASRIGLP